MERLDLHSSLRHHTACYRGIYSARKKEQTSAPLKEEDTDDDFDDFSEDLDEDLPPTKERSYVSLNFDKAEAFATEAFHKAKEVISDSVQQVKDTVKSVKEGQANKEVVVDVPTEDVTIEDAADAVEDAVEDVAENITEAAEEFFSEDEPIEETVEEAKDTISDAAEDVADAAKSTVSNVVEDIENAIENLAEEIYGKDHAGDAKAHVPSSETIEEFFDEDDEPTAF